MDSKQDESDYGWFDLDELDKGDDEVAVSRNNLWQHGVAVNDFNGSGRSHPHTNPAEGGADRWSTGRIVQPDLVTRCFLGKGTSPNGRDATWAWGVGGLRIHRSRQGVPHAEFQVVASLDGRSMTSWKRISKIAALAKHARDTGAWSTSAQEAWEQLHRAVSSNHERTSQFLRHVCILLHEFLRQYLFVCDDLNSLVAFVSQSSSSGHGHGHVHHSHGHARAGRAVGSSSRTSV